MSTDEVDLDLVHMAQKNEQDALHDPLADIPPLTTHIATSHEDRVEGLKLVADSVAQQRQWASRILIFHPLNMAIYIGVLAIMAQYCYKSTSDLPLIFTTGAGITMAFLVTVRWATSGYLLLAEEMNWEWVSEDQILITKFGEETVGALVLGWERGEGRGNKRKKGRGIIRAWTTKLRYRGKGVGTGLLEEAIKIVETKGGEEIVFAEDHANSKRVLKPIYNGPFDSKDRKSRQALQDIVDNTPNFGRKR